MRKLIDLEAAIEVIRFDSDRIPDDLGYKQVTAYRNGMYAAVQSISSCPIIDAVEVVRCKDCVHVTPVEGGLPLCTLHDRACAYNDFCSYGERGDTDDL